MSFFKKLFGKKQEETSTAVENLAEDSLQETGDLEVEAPEGDDEKVDTVVAEKTDLEEAQAEVVEEKADDLTEVAPKNETDEASVEEMEQLTAEASNDEIVEEIEQHVEGRKTVENEEAPVVEEASVEETVLEQPTEKPHKEGFVKRLFSGLSKTRDSILKGVDDVLSNFKHIDEELYEELEEALIMADFGVDTTLHIMEKLKAKVKEDKITDPAGLKPALQTIITDLLTEQPTEDILNPAGPTVVLVIGVNGVGKTTSIGKMSHLFKSQHKKVLVAAADTFRAAAIEQLNVWTDRAGVELIKHEEGSDAAAVVFDAISAAKSRKSDVLICDTAGRLQNKTNLMKELEKISRIIAREYPEAKKEILIVLDATTGQNAMQQVKLFKEVADISGIVLTKLDGTAKGGAIVGIYESLKVPVKYIGVGEKIDDLQPFDANAFAKALFEEEA